MTVHICNDKLFTFRSHGQWWFKWVLCRPEDVANIKRWRTLDATKGIVQKRCLLPEKNGLEDFNLFWERVPITSGLFNIHQMAELLAIYKSTRHGTSHGAGLLGTLILASEARRRGGEETLL